jgi:hypothetical protein
MNKPHKPLTKDCIYKEDIGDDYIIKKESIRSAILGLLEENYNAIIKTRECISWYAQRNDDRVEFWHGYLEALEEQRKDINKWLGAVLEKKGE